MNFRHLKCCCFENYEVSDTEIKLQRSHSKNIDKFLSKHEKLFKSKHFILLLGTGESGKSTFVNQLRIIHNQKFSGEELKKYQSIIYDNIFKGILFLIDARSKLGIDWKNPQTKESANYLEIKYEQYKTNCKDDRSLFEMWDETDFLNCINHLKIIWNDETTQISFNRRSEFITDKFSENIRYYMNNIDIIGVKNYVPTNEHIVWSRYPTHSVKELEIPIYSNSNSSTNEPEARLIFVDVGGESRERHKWCTLLFSCSTRLSSLLFLVGSSQYDEYYYDKLSGCTRNKITESMFVFSQLINHSALINCTLIIFFNKFDILKEKIEKKVSNIKEIFVDEKFPKNFDSFNIEHVQQFLVDKYVNLIQDAVSLSFNNPYTSNYYSHNTSLSPNSPNKRMVYRHFTTAVDSNNIKCVFIALKDAILQSNIRKIMMN